MAGGGLQGLHLLKLQARLRSCAAVSSGAGATTKHRTGPCRSCCGLVYRDCAYGHFGGVLDAANLYLAPALTMAMPWLSANCFDRQICITVVPYGRKAAPPCKSPHGRLGKPTMICQGQPANLAMRVRVRDYGSSVQPSWPRLPDTSMSGIYAIVECLIPAVGAVRHVKQQWLDRDHATIANTMFNDMSTFRWFVYFQMTHLYLITYCFSALSKALSMTQRIQKKNGMSHMHSAIQIISNSKSL